MTFERRDGAAESELWLPRVPGSFDPSAFVERVLHGGKARVEQHAGVSVAPHHVQVFADPAIDAVVRPGLAALIDRVQQAVASFGRHGGHILVAPVEVEWFSMGLQEPSTLSLTITFGRLNPSEYVADRTVDDPLEELATDPPGLAAAARRIADGTPPALDFASTATFSQPTAAELAGDGPPEGEPADDESTLDEPPPTPSGPALSTLPSVQMSRELAARSRPPWGALVDAGGRKYLLRGSVVVGREAPADLAVGTDTVSGRHALLVNKGPGRCFVHDMDSLNGTAVNGTATRSIAAITHGDVLTFGSLSLRFEEV